jgi:hypothetical protein
MVNAKPKNQQNQSESPSSFLLIDSLKKSTKNIFQKAHPYERLLCSDKNASMKNRLRNARHATAKSKSGVWGPTHSFDSDDDNDSGSGNGNGNDNEIFNDHNHNSHNFDKDNFNESYNDHSHDNDKTLNKTLGERSGGDTTNTTQESFSCSYAQSTLNQTTATATPLTTSKRSRTFSSSPKSTLRRQAQFFASENTQATNGNTNASTKYHDNYPVNSDQSARKNIDTKRSLEHQDQEDDQVSPLSPFNCAPSNEDGSASNLFAGIWNSATFVINELFAGDCNNACNQCQGKEEVRSRGKNHSKSVNDTSKHEKSTTGKSPKSPNKKIKKDVIHEEAKSLPLGIQRLAPPSKEISFKYQRSNASSLTDGIQDINNAYINQRPIVMQKEIGDDEARAAAKLMAQGAKNNTTSNQPTPLTSKGRKNIPNTPEIKKNKNQAPPFNTINVNTAVPFQKSISELTMRSSYGEAVTPVSDMRRMAYYAVGKNHTRGSNGTVNGGNRKCYFTGDPIIGGHPFYAGSVRQGLRTLIVFCLPSALGLPKRADLEKVSEMELNSQIGTKSPDELSRRTMTGLSTAALSQHDSIYNEDGFVMSELFQSTAWTEDENGNLCESLNPDFLIQALPDPSNDVLQLMEKSFPEEFASLSPQLRRPHCWRLYVKFCFFSGLPIADGEMYYKVMDEVVGKRNKKIEEIALSHEVMEAVSGESAEILTLPGKKTFHYLQKHYKQQCAKLTPQKLYKKVFDRSSWVRVMPEI